MYFPSTYAIFLTRRRLARFHLNDAYSLSRNVSGTRQAAMMNPRVLELNAVNREKRITIVERPTVDSMVRDVPDRPDSVNYCIMVGALRTHPQNLLGQSHPFLTRPIVVHAEKGSEEVEGELEKAKSARPTQESRGNAARVIPTNNIVTTVKAMTALPCSTLSSPVRADLISMTLSCCCLRAIDDSTYAHCIRGLVSEEVLFSNRWPRQTCWQMRSADSSRSSSSSCRLRMR